MIGGRNGWIAWPAGILCAGVVAGLVWLARPAVPAVVGFAGGILQAATTAATTGRTGAPATADPRTTPGENCRSLYPRALWLRLTWPRTVVLDQTSAQPQTEATTVRAALAPRVIVTCTWHDGPQRTVTTTASRVGTVDAAAVRGDFVAKGFACTSGGVGIHCTRTSGGTSEDDIVRDGLWLSTTERQWHPPGYSTELVAGLWP